MRLQLRLQRLSVVIFSDRKPEVIMTIVVRELDKIETTCECNCGCCQD